MLDYLAQLWRTYLDVVTLTPAPELLHGTRWRWLLAVGIVVVSALSGLVGRAGLLAINRVRGAGVLAAWAMTSAQQVLAQALEGLVLWCVTALVLGDAPTVGAVVRVVLLSNAPLWWAWITITPFIGLLLERLLWVWTLLCTWGLMGHLMPARPSAAVLAVVLAGWLASRLVAAVADAPTRWLRNAVWRRLMGRDLRASAAELLSEASPQVLAADLPPPGSHADVPVGVGR